MKQFIFLFLALFILSSCKDSGHDKSAFATAGMDDLIDNMDLPTVDGKIDSSKMAKIDFKETVFDFGKINEGDVVEHDFEFKNTGEKKLMLLYHQTTCGCTVPEFSKDPYDPGKSGKITIRFDSTGKKLKQTKKVKIFTNAYPNMTELTVTGYVIPKN